MSDRILRRPAVERRCGLSTRTLYRLASSGQFPRQVKISRGGVGWRESEISRWIESRVPVEEREETQTV